MDHMVPATRSAAEKAYRKIESINVAVGNFFFQYRNGLFPVIFILAALTLRPSIMFDSPLADRSNRRERHDHHLARRSCSAGNHWF